MKAVSLFSCIMLSISVILLLSTGAQATEYKEVNTEVNASSITEHVENSDDIYLDNCSIVGELNTSKIKLETVPNPEYYTLLSESGFVGIRVFESHLSYFVNLTHSSVKLRSLT